MTMENKMLIDSKADQGNGAAATTQDVLKHHLNCLANRDLSGFMADDAPESRFFTPDGVLRGSAAIRAFFRKIFDEFANPGASFQMLREDVEGDTAYIVWKAEIEDNRYDFASDTFVVQNGKNVTQTLAGKLSLER